MATIWTRIEARTLEEATRIATLALKLKSNALASLRAVTVNGVDS